MVYSQKEETAGEIAAKGMSKKAFEAYSGISPLSVIERETDEGKRYYVDGAFERNDLTFEQLQQLFEDMYDDAHITDKEMEAIAIYMDDEIREKVHSELTPCTHEQFLLRYIELDPEFVKTMEQEFSTANEKLDLYR